MSVLIIALMDKQYNEPDKPINYENSAGRKISLGPKQVAVAALVAIGVCATILYANYRIINSSRDRLGKGIEDRNDRLVRIIEGTDNSHNNRIIGLIDQTKDLRSDLRDITDHNNQIVDTLRKELELVKNHNPLATRVDEAFQNYESTKRRLEEQAKIQGRELSKQEETIIQNSKGQYDQASADLEKDLKAYLKAPIERSR